MEFEFTYDVIEKILVKKALTDKKYLNVMTRIPFEARWISVDKHLAGLVEIAIAYYKKFDSLPNNTHIQYLIPKYCESRANDTKHELHGVTAADLNKKLQEINSFNLDINSAVAIENLNKFVKQKMLYFLICDNANDMMKSGTVDKCLDRFEKFEKISFEDNDIGMVYFDKDAQDKHWEYIQNPEAKIRTGWDGLDRYTNNGIPKEGKFLGLFLAQSGAGKSLFLSNIAVNFLRQNLKVGVISMEMSENVYAQRFTAHISENNINTLKNTASDSRAKIDEFYKQYPNANLVIKEYPPHSINSRDIDNYLESLQSSGIKLDVLIVDYLSLISSNRKCDTMFEEGKLVAEELRALSYKWGIPIMSAVQSNTEGMNNEHIDMENVSQSRGIVFTADFIAALYRMDEDREHGIINMRIIKNRLGGMVGKVIQFKQNDQNLIVKDTTFADDEEDDESENILGHINEISNDVDSVLQ